MSTHFHNKVEYLCGHDLDIAFVLYPALLICSEMVADESDCVIIYLEIGVIELYFAFASVNLINRHLLTSRGG